MRLRALLAAVGAALVTGAGYAALVLGVHGPGPAQRGVQAIALPVLSLCLAFDELPPDSVAWLAFVLGFVLWFGLIFAGLGTFPRRRQGTPGT